MRTCTYLFVAAAAFLLSGCTNEALYVQSKYVTYEDLTSYHVETPDPRKKCPDIGQQLLVCWSLPKCAMEAEELILQLQIHYGNHEHQAITVPIDKKRGMFIYSLLNDEYFCRDGIESYLAEIFSDGEVIEEWRHQIWTDRIEFDTEV